MRALTLWLLTLVIFTLPTPASQSQGSKGLPQTPDLVVKEFYRWYVHTLNRNANPLKQRTTLGKYVTKRLIREIERQINSPDGLDADYFLDAQDWDKDWERNIQVSKLEVKGAIATARVTLTGKVMSNYRLKVTLKQEQNDWKIDKVQRADT